ncbi:MAG TPA: translation elongation factor Ts, partial [Caulobacteraceae bacterium]|nr:translation elongation factor Ts [Caulobacteraceae bacterium]
MAEITAGQVKELREKSGAGMMDCKRALTETNGDLEAAQDWLKVKGLSKASKKADRVAAEGLVAVALRSDGRGMTGAVTELNAETDFVARNQLFQAAALKVADAALDAGGDVDAIAHAKTTDGESIGDMITHMIATIGENMRLRRAGFVKVDQGAVAAYVHNAVAPNVGRIGVLVGVEGAGDQAKLQDLGKKIAMHVAATQPLSLSEADMDPAVIDHERQILTEQALESGRPANIVERMVDGRIRKFLEEVVLLKQAFVMNPDQTVEQLVAETGKALGSP